MRKVFSSILSSFRYSALAAVALAVLPVWNVAGGNEGVDDRGAVRLLKTVPIPGTAANTTNGKLYRFDISFVDQATQTYYLADPSNAVVDVVDAKAGSFVKQISGGFKGIAVVGGVVQGGQSGPNGVVAAFPWLFVTDAPSRVVSIDLRTDTVVSSVSTGGADNFRADELAYDPKDGLLLVINPNDSPPFGTLITVNTANGHLTVGMKIPLPFATNGAEQPVWDPSTGKFYLSIPQIGLNPKDGGVVRIDPNTAMVETTYAVEHCGPGGLTVGPRHDVLSPRHDLLIGCGMVFDTSGNVWDPSGTVTAAPKDVILDVLTGGTTDVPGAGAGDEVSFNSGDGKYYATGSGSPLRPTPSSAAQGATVLAVIDAEDRNLIQLLPTFNVPAVGTGNSTTQHPAGTAHSVAVNAKNNYVFVPLAANNVFPNCLTGCIAVFVRSSKVQ